MMFSYLRCALAYAALGWPVFPTRGKTPFMKGGFHLATTDTDIIRRWWGRWPNADISLGAMPKFWVLDVDRDKGGQSSLGALIAKYGALPETPTQLSGGGGLHYLFQPLQGLKNISGGQTEWWPWRGVDILTNSILVAPSVHPDTGALYEWKKGKGPRDIPLAPAPEWLCMLVTPPPVREYDAPRIEGAALDRCAHWVLDRAIKEITSAVPGCRDNTVNRAAFNCGRFVGAGKLDKHDTEHALISAALSLPGDKSWDRSAVARKVSNSLRNGIEKGSVR